jgi:hypothetical protein
MERKTLAQALAELDVDSWYPTNSNIPAHQHDSSQHVQRSLGTQPNAVFQRLRWSVLDPPSEVEVFGPNDKGVLLWQPLFERPFADEAVMDPPYCRLEVSIEPLRSWWHWYDAGIEHLRPPKRLIENADGQHISVRQFIEAVHDYAVPLRKLLLRCMDISDPTEQAHARFYFQVIMDLSGGPPEGAVQGASVYVVEDPTGDGEKCLLVWQDIETRVKDTFVPQ